MMTKICERCDKEMKLVPAGVSRKTNKSYSAFWSCDSRSGGCGNTARAEGEAASPAPFADGAPVSSERLDAIERKLDEIIEMLKGAV
jgi:hypothetical protein